MKAVSIVSCPNYQEKNVQTALQNLLAPIEGLEWVKEGMKIVIKANLVSMMKPEAAATTHPSLLCQLVKILTEKGASVVIGDSPGGLYHAAMLNRVYQATGMKDAEAAGAQLNRNFETTNAAFPTARIAKDFVYTAYLDEADAIINFCKLKTHGMMGMSASVKNMFGAIPGTFKPEYHFRFPNHLDFASMLLDINDYFGKKIKLNIVDAVIGMEGNGPTQGKPRPIGALLASSCPHSLDLLSAALIGLTPSDVPTLEVAQKEALIPNTAEDLDIYGNWKDFIQTDFQTIPVHRSLQFEGAGKFASMFVKSALCTCPLPDKKLCIGCKKCAEICPAHVIEMKNGLPTIDRNKCIACFCCQEFCPVGAMKVHRPLIARILNRKKD